MDVSSSRLHPDLLLNAYCSGYFPMADPEGRIGWFHPDPRAIIELSGFKIPRSLRQRWIRGDFEIRLDTQFDAVISGCADRPEGTWISSEIIEAYCSLAEEGWAHSVETYYEDELVGGLYGVSIGGAFFGESMYSRRTDASKLALVALVEQLKRCRFELLDIQFITPHLQRFGAIAIPLDEYLRRLESAIGVDTDFLG